MKAGMENRSVPPLQVVGALRIPLSPSPASFRRTSPSPRGIGRTLRPFDGVSLPRPRARPPASSRAKSTGPSGFRPSHGTPRAGPSTEWALRTPPGRAGRGPRAAHAKGHPDSVSFPRGPPVLDGEMRPHGVTGRESFCHGRRKGLGDLQVPISWKGVVDGRGIQTPLFAPGGRGAIVPT